MLIEDFESNFIVILSKYINEILIIKWLDGTKVKALISNKNKNKEYSDNEKICFDIVEIIHLDSKSFLFDKNLKIGDELSLSYQDFPEKICSLDYYVIWSIEYEFNRKLLVFLSRMTKKDSLLLLWKDGTTLEAIVDSNYHTNSFEIEAKVDKLNPRFQDYHLIRINVKKVISLSVNFDYYDEIIHGNTLLSFSHKNAPYSVYLKNKLIYDFKKELKNLKKKDISVFKGEPYLKAVYSPDFTGLIMINSLIYMDTQAILLTIKEIKNSIYKSNNKLDSVLLLSYLSEAENEYKNRTLKVYPNPLNKNANILQVINSLKRTSKQNRDKIVLLLESNILRNSEILDVEFLFSHLTKVLAEIS